MSLHVPLAVRAAVASVTHTAPPGALRALAVWAAEQLPPPGSPWTDLLDLARRDAPAEVLRDAHARMNSAAALATVIGLLKGLPGAACQLAAFHAVHPDPAEAARRTVEVACAWHRLAGDVDAFTVDVVRQAELLG